MPLTTEEIANAVVELIESLNISTIRTDLARSILEVANNLMGGFGVETVTCGEDECQYVNMGDAYKVTLMWDHNGDLTVGSWGDWMEEQECKHTEATGDIRCGYCGEFTACPGAWHDTRCTHCGHNVASGEIMPEPKDEDEESESSSEESESSSEE